MFVATAAPTKPISPNTMNIIALSPVSGFLTTVRLITLVSPLNATVILAFPSATALITLPLIVATFSSLDLNSPYFLTNSATSIVLVCPAVKVIDSSLVSNVIVSATTYSPSAT